MPKRGTDADSRIFFDELAGVVVSRLKATGLIRLEDQWAHIPFGEQTKLIGVSHTKFPSGGSWAYFRCPKCGARSKKLWLVDDAPRCRLCLEKLGVRYRAAYGFGRTERLRERDRRVDRLQAMLEGAPMRFKPMPPNWGDRRLDRRNRLTAALQRARNHTWRRTFKSIAIEAGISTRLSDWLTGHARQKRKRGAAADYEVPTLAALAKAVRQYPRYQLPE
jgi:hypothetical protein